MAAAPLASPMPQSPRLSPIRGASNDSIAPISSSCRTPSPVSSYNESVLQSTPQSNRNQVICNLTSQFSNTSMPICRICHDTDIREELISPCRCSGTMGLIHRSCIEKWLGASNSDRCEICSFRFIIKRSPRPFVDWLRQPSRPTDRRNVFGDIVCFVLLTPLACVSAWLCITGASHYSQFDANTWETAGLIALSVFLFAIYLIWCVVAIRYHVHVYIDWRKSNQVIKVVDLSSSPPSTSSTALSLRSGSDLNNMSTTRVPLVSPHRYNNADNATAGTTTVAMATPYIYQVSTDSDSSTSLNTTCVEITEPLSTSLAGPLSSSPVMAVCSDRRRPADHVTSAGQVWLVNPGRIERGPVVRANQSDTVVYVTVNAGSQSGRFTRVVRETYV